MERDDPTLDSAMDSLFRALESIDELAGGLMSPTVRETLDFRE